MTLSTSFLDELRARTSLSALIGRTVSLKKAGRELKGCCPFHNEKTPSFHVNDEKGFYHCFGCAAHGDAIRWLTEQQGLPFMDAVKELAAAAGMDVPASDPRQVERDRERGEMLDIMARASRWYIQRREHALDYLRSRGIDEATADTFEIGCAPSSSRAPTLSQHLVDIPVGKLASVGLVKIVDGKEPYDTFRRRLMFPIHDTRGNVIAFGGRIIGQGEPKYLNSPDTPLFDKGRTLFNHHRAAPAARRTGRLVIVEGYMDVIALTTAGIAEAVAPNGTAITEAQLAAAWRLADNPILCMDGDKAGQAAAARAAVRALPLLEPGRSLAFVSPPAGRDPDDVLREGGATAVEALLSKPRWLVDVLWEAERAAGPLDTPEQVAGFRARLRAHVKTIRSADVRRAYGEEIRKRLDASVPPAGGFAQIRSRPMERPVARRTPPPPASAAQRSIAREGIGSGLEHAIMVGLSLYPDVALQNFERLAMAVFRTPALAAMRDRLVQVVAMERVSADQVPALLEEMGLRPGGLPLPFTRPNGGQDVRDRLARALEALSR